MQWRCQPDDGEDFAYKVVLRIVEQRHASKCKRNRKMMINFYKTNAVSVACTGGKEGTEWDEGPFVSDEHAICLRIAAGVQTSRTDY